nr:sigma factor-like helix-turn-helix DNA-binding protein [uncultured Cohaesibacter sp.]
MAGGRISRYSEKEAALANVPLLYYGEGLTQSDIARRMGVSRATVVNMLREAREQRIVDISVDGKYLAGSSLSQDLKAKFGLSDVYIPTTEREPGQTDRAEILRQTGAH